MIPKVCKTKIRTCVWLILMALLCIWLSAENIVHAQTTDREFNIDYNDNLLTISAQDVEVKKVLLTLSKKTDVFVWCSKSINRRISMDQSGIPLAEALDRLLVGLNYFIIYSGPQRNQAGISEVYVFANAKRGNRRGDHARHVANRIRAYERRIESLRKGLAGIRANSVQGRKYLRQIRRLENNIDRLERRLN